MINYEQEYSKIVLIRPNFDDTFNLVQEKPDAWRSFITNEQFEINLKKIFNAFSATKANINNRKSIWIQGTYGTGKSHSTAVVKHLLCDDMEDIGDFVKSLDDKSLRAMIGDFRRDHRAFPVVLRGAYTISNVTDMCYEIQKQTREALNKEGIKISINTDFEKAIDLLDDPYMESFWSKLLDNELKIYCKDKIDIKNALEKFDKEILSIIDSRYRTINNGSFGTSSITKWLKDVQKELIKINKADHLVIIWDEFTALLSSQESRGILNTAQDIAELAKEEDENGDLYKIYLIVVTHKNIEQTDAFRSRNDNEQKLALARFVTCSYDMQPNTTYHILSSTFNRIDENALNELIEQRVNSDVAVTSIVDRIAESTKGNVREIKSKIISLYPFHPYTAYLSTFVSRQLGDSERSIFNFLNDEEVGFKKFLTNKISDVKFLAPSSIWDFFLKISNSSIINAKLSEVINKYNMHLDTVKKKSRKYVDVFKTVLLLNALSSVVSAGEDNNERSLVTPNISNINSCFSGIMSEDEVSVALEYFDKNNIIMKSAEGIFEVSTTAISTEKLKEISKNKAEYYNEITKAISDFPLAFNPLKQAIGSNSNKIVRETEVLFLSTILKNTQIDVQLKNGFKAKHSVHICVFLSHGPADITKNLSKERSKDEINEYIRAISNQEEYSNVIFMNIETPFTELYFSRFIDSTAKMEIHENIKPEESNNEKNRATGWLKKWVDSIINDGYAFLGFRGKTSAMNFKASCNLISDHYIKFIFKNGLDSLKTTRIKPIWDKKNAKAIIENILNYDKREDIESKLRGGLQTNIQALLKDENGNYIFDNDMNLIDGVDEENPVVVLVRKIKDLLIPGENGAIIDLQSRFKDLFEPPYGLYDNPISYAAFSIAIRPYIDKLFAAKHGSKIDKVMMKDLVESLFRAELGGKSSPLLDVRFSSAEEIELIDVLVELFGLKEKGLMRIRWELRDSFDKSVNAPFWMLKLVDNPSKDLCKAITDIFKFTIATDETISQTTINEVLSEVKNFRLEIKKAFSKAKTMNLVNDYISIVLAKSANQNILSDEDFVYYNNYIKANTQEQRPFWREDQLSLEITKAYYEKIKAINSEKDEDVKIEIKNTEEKKENATSEQEEVLKKIKLCSDLNVLKNILADIISNNIISYEDIKNKLK